MTAFDGPGFRVNPGRFNFPVTANRPATTVGEPGAGKSASEPYRRRHRAKPTMPTPNIAAYSSGSGTAERVSTVTLSK